MINVGNCRVCRCWDFIDVVGECEVLWMVGMEDVKSVIISNEDLCMGSVRVILDVALLGVPWS